jgi:UDP-2,3-diacylglucosamine pyrophosphatase LpxH
MPSRGPEIADLLEVVIPPGNKVITFSDLHLPPVRTDVSGRSCETLARHLNAETGPLTVVFAGDVVEMLGSPGATATDILRAHEDLCAALVEVTARGGQVVYTIGNHDGDLAWDVKTADAVREMTGATLCLAADLILADGRKIRVEHGHQLDPYNCFCDARNPLDTPIGHHVVREVIPRIEWLGRGWVDGAHEMADPTDFPSFIASRLVYRKLGRHLWWLIAIPLVILILVRIPEFTDFRTRHPDTSLWVHRAVILGYGAVADLVVIAALVGILVRRAWLSISALALEERGYGQNQAARQRAVDLVADGYYGFITGHTHHPELAATANGFYANSGSCTSVVEGIGGRFGLPPAYVRNQQICWLEIAGGKADLVSARVELPGATRMERFVAHGRNPHADTPVRVASWPAGPDWPPPENKADRKKPLRCTPAGPEHLPDLAALGGPSLLDGELRRGVGFQSLIGDRLAAADGPAVAAVV